MTNDRDNVRRIEAGSDSGAPDTAAADRVRVVETHISVLVFVGDRVFKFHKPVRYSFLDFSEREAREEACRREVALNRRLAPDVYLGVADLSMDGVPLDHMVVMRALPDERRLSVLVRSGAEVNACLDRVAGTLAVFHGGADRSPAIAEAGSPAVRRSEWESNFAETARFVGPILDPGVEEEIQRTALDWVARHEHELTQRMRSGQVCDGHGDLQADDIFCLDDDVRILDCLEFSDSLRHGDVCADVAFLAMDLERLSDGATAMQFVTAYETHAGAQLPRPLLHHYIGLRAYVRAKVACLQHEQGTPGAEATARTLHDLALHHMRRSRQVLVLVGGLPGSGKSTLASGLSYTTGWVRLRSDEVRSRVADDGRHERYSPEAVAATYEELVRQARRYLDAGEGVILDASWISADHRSLARGAAAASGSELIEIWCASSAPIAEARIRRRLGEGNDASEATVEVRAAMAKRVDDWPTARVVDTSDRTPGETLSEALGAISVRGPAPGT